MPIESQLVEARDRSLEQRFVFVDESQGSKCERLVESKGQSEQFPAFEPGEDRLGLVILQDPEVLP